MTDPSTFTDARWAAKQAREQALEEAAELALEVGTRLGFRFIAAEISGRIRALKSKPTGA